MVSLIRLVLKAVEGRVLEWLNLKVLEILCTCFRTELIKRVQGQLEAPHRPGGVQEGHCRRVLEGWSDETMEGINMNHNIEF